MTKHKHAGYWKDFDNVKKELIPIIKKLRHFPTLKELSLKDSSLYNAIQKYGGLSEIRNKMGYSYAKPIKPQLYSKEQKRRMEDMRKKGLERLTDEFFARSPEAVAVDLLGAKIVRNYHGKRIKATVYETEAYHGMDGNLTERRAKLCREAGKIALYHAGFSKKKRTRYDNVLAISTDSEGEPSVVVINGIKDKKEEVIGPYNITRKLKVNGTFDNLSINGKKLYILPSTYHKKEVLVDKTSRKSSNHLATYSLKL